MKALLGTVCLLLLNMVVVSSAGASSWNLNNASALTSEEARFVFGDANQAHAIMPLSGEEMASTRGNSICMDIVGNGQVYVICNPPDPLEWFE